MSAKNDDFETLNYDENGQSVEVLIRKEDCSAWLTVDQMVKLFDVSERTIRRHLGKKTIDGHASERYDKRYDKYDKRYDKTVIDPSPKNAHGAKLYDFELVLSIGASMESKRGEELLRWLNGKTQRKPPENSFVIIYDNGEVNLDVRFTPEGDDVWLTQNQMATLFETTQQNIAAHIKNIYEDKELDVGATHKYFLLVHPNS